MVTFDKTQSCNTDTHCLASLLDEFYVKWPFKMKTLPKAQRTRGLSSS